MLDRRWDKNSDLGQFELAYKQPQVTIPPYIGINLSVEGNAVKKPSWMLPPKKDMSHIEANMKYAHVSAKVPSAKGSVMGNKDTVQGVNMNIKVTGGGTIKPLQSAVTPSAVTTKDKLQSTKSLPSAPANVIDTKTANNNKVTSSSYTVSTKYTQRHNCNTSNKLVLPCAPRRKNKQRHRLRNRVMQRSTPKSDDVLEDDEDDNDSEVSSSDSVSPDPKPVQQHDSGLGSSINPSPQEPSSPVINPKSAESKTSTNDTKACTKEPLTYCDAQKHAEQKETLAQNILKEKEKENNDPSKCHNPLTSVIASLPPNVHGRMTSPSELLQQLETKCGAASSPEPNVAAWLKRGGGGVGGIGAVRTNIASNSMESIQEQPPGLARLPTSALLHDGFPKSPDSPKVTVTTSTSSPDTTSQGNQGCRCLPPPTQLFSHQHIKLLPTVTVAPGIRSPAFHSARNLFKPQPPPRPNKKRPKSRGSKHTNNIVSGPTFGLDVVPQPNFFTPRVPVVDPFKTSFKVPRVLGGLTSSNHNSHTMGMTYRINKLGGESHMRLKYLQHQGPTITAMEKMARVNVEMERLQRLSRASLTSHY